MRMTPNNHLTGMIAAYVDDLLMSGDGGAEASLFQLGQRLGFLERPNGIVWCGKQFTRNARPGEVTIDMCTYRKNLKQRVISRERKHNPSSLLGPQKLRQLRGVYSDLCTAGTSMSIRPCI